MGKWFLAALAAAAICGNARAGERRYLFPIDPGWSVLSVAPDLQAYHVTVRDALVRNAGTHSWEAVVLPSFHREWAVYVESSGAGGGQRLVCTVMQTQLWYQMEGPSERAGNANYPKAALEALRKAKKETSRHAVPISAGTAAVLEKVWFRMIAEARQPPKPAICLDGTGYFLLELKGGALTRGGFGRCPQEGTPPLVGLTILKKLRTAAVDSKSGAWEGEVVRLLRGLE